MSFTLGLLALTLTPQAADPVATKPARIAALEAEVTAAARGWLELGDAGQWEASWRATGDQFRTLNTLAVWTQVSRDVRVPLGAVISREMVTHNSVPAPPAGVEVVSFRTDFANRKGAIETVSLAREHGAWKVVGVYLD